MTDVSGYSPIFMFWSPPFNLNYLKDYFYLLRRTLFRKTDEI